MYVEPAQKKRVTCTRNVIRGGACHAFLLQESWDCLACDNASVFKHARTTLFYSPTNLLEISTLGNGTENWLEERSTSNAGSVWHVNECVLRPGAGVLIVYEKYRYLWTRIPEHPDRSAGC